MVVVVVVEATPEAVVVGPNGVKRTAQAAKRRPMAMSHPLKVLLK